MRRRQPDVSIGLIGIALALALLLSACDLASGDDNGQPRGDGLLTGTPAAATTPASGPGADGQQSVTPTPVVAFPDLEVGPVTRQFLEELTSGPTPTPFPLPTQADRGPGENGDEESGAVAATREPDGEDPFSLDLSGEALQRLETEHFTFYTQAETDAEFSWSALRPWTVVEDEAEEIFDYVTQRLGSDYDEQIAVHFRAPADGECPPRGMAIPSPPDERNGEPLIFLFVGPETTEEQIEGVLAHEVAHIVHLRGMPEALGGTGMLNEALATWAAEAYQVDWYDAPSYDALVLQYLIEGNYLPLHRYHELSAVYDTLEPGQDCLELRDTIYTEWASFIGFLIDHYGWERFEAFMQSTQGRGTETEAPLNPPDYEGVYGLALNQLEAQWLVQILVAAK